MAKDMNFSLIQDFQRRHTVLRTISVVMLVAFTSQTLQPLAAAVNQPKVPVMASKPLSDEAQLAQTLEKIEKHLGKLERKLTKKQDATREKSELKQLQQDLIALDKKAMASFDKIEQHLKAKRLPKVILERHAQAVARYRDQFSALTGHLNGIKAAATDKEKRLKIRQTKAYLEKNQKRKRRTPLDPNNLPFRTPDGKVRKPYKTKEEFKQAGLIPEPKIRLASSMLTPSLLAGALVASTAPQPEDLLPTEDVQITQQIKDLADQLGHNPVKIYNWVHDNIEFIPTYGSIQGSQMTLEAKRGNAFDTSSLLIALLRASGIHSRYIYGTIRVPVEKVMNWVDGVEVPEGAQQLLGQGGIPNTAIVVGGKIKYIEMEHIWVEAWIDFQPSRGSLHKYGDTWVPMDGSFKQHDFTVGSNILTDIPFDIEALSNQILQTAQINEQEGWIVNVDQNLVLSNLTAYQAQIDAYIAAKGQSVTLNEIIGGQTIVKRDETTLGSGLPYEYVIRTGATPELSSSIRYLLKINGYTTSLDRILGSPSFSYTISLPRLNSRKIGVTYKPASEADAQVLQSYIDNGAASLPLYLIYVKPAITLDGVQVALGSSIPMGSQQYIDVFFNSGRGSNRVPYEVISGDEIVFGVNGNGIAPEVVKARFDNVSSDNASENLHQVALHYWMEYDFLDHITARGQGVHVQRLPSLGLFSSPLNVSYFFGLPRSGVYQSRIMDVKRVISAVVSDSSERKRSFMQQSGMQGSYLEGSVFDQLFKNGRGSGISAAQLLMDSNLQGIPIYRITQQNLAEVLPILSVDSEIKADISNSVNAGKIAIVPKREISRGSWSGTGYIIQDAVTGAGAYLLSGGLNGGGDIECEPGIQPLFEIILFIILAVLLAYLIFLTAGALAGALTGIPALVEAMVASFVIFFATSPAYAGDASDFEDCVAQWEDDTRWCDNTYTGRDNFACHEWAHNQLTRCKKGCSREPFRL